MKLAKSYQAELYETDIYALWEKTAAFQPKGKGRGYSIVAPPPNANGNLHMGHALAFAWQDIAARYHRSIGQRVLYIPGADHAGFETQVVFERELEKKGKSRFDYSRESLFQEIYQFVATNRYNLESQIRRLGASVDWTHYTFTLDESVVKQAYATFKAMWNEGLIYRGERLVNFCTFHGTAFADIEVDYTDENTFLWQLSYPLTDGSGEVIVSTTRPETMLGDTAVAVNPNDERYQAIIGKTVKLPLTSREIPIVADSYVDPKFGTGAVKITPAHDPNDFEIAQRHDLPLITIIGFDGKLNHQVPKEFRGLSVLEGREAVIKQLKDLGFLIDAQEYTHSVGHCYKCGTIIQPLLKDQWFVDIKPLAEPAIKALNENLINFLPETKKNQLIDYLKSIKDWNISRQIAWGIPIPAFQNVDNPNDWIYSEQVDQEIITINQQTYRRDPDVLDTWFSSSSWPYVTLGYPDGSDFKDFYPLSFMETGFDILMPWVSRMLMLGLYTTTKIPFSTVYLHGLMTDPKGRKMSKSKGNGVDPLEIADKYGSDALRLGVITGQTPGNNQPFIVSKVIGGRNFCNKLWNIARYIESQLTINPILTEVIKPNQAVDDWILNRYQEVKKEYVKLMDNYRFSEAFELIYHFTWDDLADWYIEASKTQPNPTLLKSLLEGLLVLVHPFVPFLSETIWQTLEINPDSLLTGHLLIDLPAGNKSQASDFQAIQELIINVRSLVKTIGAQNVSLYYQNEPLIEKNSTMIQQLGQLVKVEPVDLGQGIAVNNSRFNCWLDINQNKIDSYLLKLNENIQNSQKKVHNLQLRLKNQNYLENAPSDLVQESKDQLIEAEQQLESLLMEKVRFNN